MMYSLLKLIPSTTDAHRLVVKNRTFQVVTINSIDACALLSWTNTIDVELTPMLSLINWYDNVFVCMLQDLSVTCLD